MHHPAPSLPTLLLLLTAAIPAPAPAFGQAAGPDRPRFRWDTVPVYLHFGKNDGLTDDEARFVATHSDFVCLEKGHGAETHGSTEAGIEHEAARLKAINPDIRVIYYWNTFLDYSMYDAHHVYNQHPEWWLRKTDGELDYKTRTLKRYDLSNPAVQDWWANEVKKAVVDGSCDGVFMDAFPQIASPGNVRLWGRAKYDAIQEGLIKTIRKTRRQIGPDKILIFNGIRNTPTRRFGTGYLAHTDAATIEHFDQFQSRDTQSLERDIEDMIAAGKRGKMVVLKGWPGFNWTEPETRDVPYEDLLARARQNITFPLACFLVAAQEHAYFCYSWGYREGHGSLSAYPEFQKPLGPPEGDAVKRGYEYTRVFERCRVWVNIETREAKIDWR
ncbi:MAG: putative glycoside hydrolase [Planctomycetota bacterium]